MNVPVRELSSEMRYRLLKALQEDPSLSQRDLATLLGISLGKINYCLSALIEKGLVKVDNFRGSHNKIAYLYLLTPRGIEEKGRVTYEFLRQKMNEADRLQREIETLRNEAQMLRSV